MSTLGGVLHNSLFYYSYSIYQSTKTKHHPENKEAANNPHQFYKQRTFGSYISKP